MSIHLNILTNKSNIRFLKDIMEKNLETEIIEALKSGKEEAFLYRSLPDSERVFDRLLSIRIYSRRFGV